MGGHFTQEGADVVSVVRRLERCRGLWEATQDDRYVAATKSRKLDPRSEAYRSELYRKLEVRERSPACRA